VTAHLADLTRTYDTGPAPVPAPAGVVGGAVCGRFAVDCGTTPAPAGGGGSAGAVLIAGAIVLTIVNLVQLGADPATDTLEGADLTALAADEASTAADDAADTDAAAACGGQSFTAGTKVLLASGAAVAISQVKVGDKVLATNTKTGKTSAEPVTAVLVHHDTDLYDLKVKTTHGTAIIDTTRRHLFWDQSTHRWVKAAALGHGSYLRTPSGAGVAVLRGSTPVGDTGWMWDLSVPGGGDHDFYIDILRTPVLVHNCPTGMPSWEEWQQNNKWDSSYTDDDGDQTPGSNQAQNRVFKSAVQGAENQLGRSLSDDEIQRLHMEISGEGLGRAGIVERAITMFGGEEP
jgi:hypothetical protein